MNKPLFYDHVVPLNKEGHKKLRLEHPQRSFEFARAANFIPALMDEFGAAMAELPIAFLPGGGVPASVFVTGFGPGSNLFLSDEGHWQASYLPAYLRRYPFIVGSVADGEPLLCIDDGYVGLNDKTGEPLFDSKGNVGPIVSDALNLAVNYKAAAERTEEFCKTLSELDLLRSVSLDTKTADGHKTVVHGLLVVDELAFDTLDADKIQMLHEKRFLKPIVQHISSLSSLASLGRRAFAREGCAGGRLDADKNVKSKSH